MTSKSLSIEESVALLINYEFFFGDVPLDEMLHAFVADAEQKNDTELEFADDMDLYAERIEVNKARLALALALRNSLEMEIVKLKADDDSDIQLEALDSDAPLILLDSLQTWAARNFGIEVPAQEEAQNPSYMWQNLTVSLEPNDMIQVKNKTEVIAFKHLTEVGLKGKKRITANQQFLVLVGMAAKVMFPPDKRTPKDSKKIADLRCSLKKLVNTKDNPFYEFNEDKGWRPRFELIDKRTVGDQRAKERAPHVEYDDARTYEKESDAADDFIDSSLD